MTQKLYDLLAEVFSISSNEISDNSSPETIENWDSFNGLVVVDKLESEYNIKFTMDEIEDVSNVSDIKRHLKNHGVKFE
jgi:acyl carrier protein